MTDERDPTARLHAEMRATIARRDLDDQHGRRVVCEQCRGLLVTVGWALLRRVSINRAEESSQVGSLLARDVDAAWAAHRERGCGGFEMTLDPLPRDWETTSVPARDNGARLARLVLAAGMPIALGRLTVEQQRYLPLSMVLRLLDGADEER